MTAKTIPAEYPVDLRDKVTRLEERSAAQGDSIEKLFKKMDQLMVGIIVVLLTVVGQLLLFLAQTVFKH